MSDKYVMLRCANCGEAVVLDEDYEYYGDGTSERRYALTHAYGYPMCRNNEASPTISVPDQTAVLPDEETR